MPAVRVGCSGWNYAHWREAFYPKGLAARNWLPHYARFFDTVRLGPVLWQLPENFHRDDERLAGALDRLPGGRHCVEFRHPSWFEPDVVALLRERGVALVIGDHPERPFQSVDLTADFTFIRFHYGHRGRNGNYSDREVEEWAKRIARWRRRVEVFAYYNNDWNAYAVHNARLLKRRLGLE